MGRRVFITVAEVSGDRHAAQLIRSLRQLDPELIIEGIGGPEMAAAGAVIHRETVKSAAMGWRGALRAAEIYKVLRWTRRHFDEHRPDVWIGVDSPSMNFHFARAARERGIPTLQYVAPQLWAWAIWRMEKLRKWVDRVACILPFEERWFGAHRVNATFVGHPLFDELPGSRRRDPPPGLPDRPPVVGLLPGSRRSEAQSNFPRMLDAGRRLREMFPGIRFLVPTTAATNPVVQECLASEAGLRGDVEFRQEAFDELVPRCDLCLTVSGTATLHVAGLGTPMIVVYGINPLAWHLAAKWLVKARTFALVNLLARGSRAVEHTRDGAAGEEHIVPEIIPWHGSTAPTAELIAGFLRQPETLAAQREKLARLIASLDHPGASMNVARLAMEMMKGKHLSSAADGSAPVAQAAR